MGKSDVIENGNNVIVNVIVNDTHVTNNCPDVTNNVTNKSENDTNNGTDGTDSGTNNDEVGTNNGTDDPIIGTIAEQYRNNSERSGTIGRTIKRLYVDITWRIKESFTYVKNESSN